MFGRPIATATIDDVQRLIDQQEPEGRHLEYKAAVPVSDQQQREQRKSDRNTIPFDKSVADGTGIGDHGRNELLEELVGFANTSGGVLVLGMGETAQRPPRAAAISPVPHVLALEGRLRNAIVDGIEPRLPSVSLKAIVTEDDATSGVLLMEVEPSVLGPHWLRATRKATVRREDINQPLSMPEIHDMVLRNARRFDEVGHRLDQARDAFDTMFAATGAATLQAGSKAPMSIEQWFATPRQKHLLGIRATIVPHQSLGLTRIESLKDLVTQGAVQELYSDGRTPSGVQVLFTQAFNERLFLGGVAFTSNRPDRHAELKVERTGFVEITMIEQRDDYRVVNPRLVLGVLGSAIVAFENLRRKSGAPSMPAELAVELRSFPKISTQFGDDHFGEEGSALSGATLFPYITIAERSDFDQVLNEVAGDFANAANISAAGLPRYHLQM